MEVSRRIAYTDLRVFDHGIGAKRAYSDDISRLRALPCFEPLRKSLVNNGWWPTSPAEVIEVVSDNGASTAYYVRNGVLRLLGIQESIRCCPDEECDLLVDKLMYVPVVVVDTLRSEDVSSSSRVLSEMLLSHKHRRELEVPYTLRDEVVELQSHFRGFEQAGNTTLSSSRRLQGPGLNRLLEYLVRHSGGDAFQDQESHKHDELVRYWKYLILYYDVVPWPVRDLIETYDRLFLMGSSGRRTSDIRKAIPVITFQTMVFKNATDAVKMAMVDSLIKVYITGRSNAKRAQWLPDRCFANHFPRPLLGEVADALGKSAKWVLGGQADDYPLERGMHPVHNLLLSRELSRQLRHDLPVCDSTLVHIDGVPLSHDHGVICEVNRRCFNCAFLGKSLEFFDMQLLLRNNECEDSVAWNLAWFEKALCRMCAISTRALQSNVSTNSDVCQMCGEEEHPLLSYNGRCVPPNEDLRELLLCKECSDGLEERKQEQSCMDGNLCELLRLEMKQLQEERDKLLRQRLQLPGQQQQQFARRQQDVYRMMEKATEGQQSVTQLDGQLVRGVRPKSGEVGWGAQKKLTVIDRALSNFRREPHVEELRKPSCQRTLFSDEGHHDETERKIELRKPRCQRTLFSDEGHHDETERKIERSDRSKNNEQLKKLRERQRRHRASRSAMEEQRKNTKMILDSGLAPPPLPCSTRQLKDNGTVPSPHQLVSVEKRTAPDSEDEESDSDEIPDSEDEKSDSDDREEKEGIGVSVAPPTSDGTDTDKETESDGTVSPHQLGSFEKRTAPVERAGLSEVNAAVLQNLGNEGYLCDTVSGALHPSDGTDTDEETEFDGTVPTPHQLGSLEKRIGPVNAAVLRNLGSKGSRRGVSFSVELPVCQCSHDVQCHDTPRDGNSLFRALSLSLFGDEGYHLELRKVAHAVYVLARPKFGGADENLAREFDAYVTANNVDEYQALNHMATPGKWMGMTSLIAVASRFVNQPFLAWSCTGVPGAYHVTLDRVYNYNAGGQPVHTLFMQSQQHYRLLVMEQCCSDRALECGQAMVEAMFRGGNRKVDNKLS